MKKRLTVLVSILVLLTCLSTAQAWSKAGHMVTGAIAYYDLRQRDPAALATVINLLKRNPHYQEWWLPAIQSLQDNDPDRHDLYLFMYAARWPDDVRSISTLHCERCHYINFPFKPPGQPNSVVALPPPQENIISAFRGFAGVLQNSPNEVRKSRALCWIFHLVGDVHQPLHTTALFTSMFPVGDRGGTRFYIRADEDADTQHLHSFWDGLVVRTDQFSTVRSRARSLRGRNDLERGDLPELSETRFDKWANPESFELAKRYGYLNGTLKGSTDDEDGVVLPDSYGGTARSIAEKRAVLAGYRLADLLSQRF